MRGGAGARARRRRAAPPPCHAHRGAARLGASCSVCRRRVAAVNVCRVPMCCCDCVLVARLACAPLPRGLARRRAATPPAFAADAVVSPTNSRARARGRAPGPRDVRVAAPNALSNVVDRLVSVCVSASLGRVGSGCGRAACGGRVVPTRHGAPLTQGAVGAWLCAVVACQFTVVKGERGSGGVCARCGVAAGRKKASGCCLGESCWVASRRDGGGSSAPRALYLRSGARRCRPPPSGVRAAGWRGLCGGGGSSGGRLPRVSRRRRAPRLVVNDRRRRMVGTARQKPSAPAAQCPAAAAAAVPRGCTYVVVRCLPCGWCCCCCCCIEAARAPKLSRQIL